MKEIIVKAKESLVVYEKFYRVKKGKVLLKNIFPNGKIVTNEHWLKTGDLIGEFLNYWRLKNVDLPDIEIEVDALEDSVLEEINFDIKEIKNNIFLNNLIKNFIRLHVFQLLFHFYDTKGYILTLLKLYSNGDNVISKEQFNVEHFNISKSQFYNVYGQLRKSGYFKEENKKIYLDRKKADEYLEKFD
ncbi:MULTISPECIES: hypothetical protein [Fusobacterium]|uniref:Uncharacterized protein n=1 Tax=Fusobacterium hominis TaxID=2764326 RepID=A0A7G9GXZ8_9FUSO|nr:MULTISPECIES: hypothetical protein [Fusobacterium]QNM15680.1 hypothetical protein H9Q81_02235 [Fusobacterium hominis]